MPKQFFLIGLVLLMLCGAVSGCESTMERIEKTDEWMRENMW